MLSGKNISTESAAPARSGERVSHRQYFVANVISVGLVLVAAVATPFAKLPLPPVPSYMTAFGTAMFVINILLAAFLFCKGASEDREDAVRLGTAYFFIAAIFVPLTASFPGGIMTGPAIGTEASSVWLWCAWHLGFGLAILRYALLPQPAGPASSVTRAVLSVILLTVLATVVATAPVAALPTVLQDGEVLFAGWIAVVPLSILVLTVVSTGAVARLGSKTPEQLWLSVGMVAVCFDVWLTYCGIERYSLGWYLAKLGSVFTSLTVIISLFYDLIRLYGRLAGANTALQDLAGRDGLTGLFNRRRLDETLALEWARAKRDDQPISMLMIDVDYFKGFNDTYGHQEGDQCLKRIALALQEAARRPADLAVRYGGEEFLVCLPSTPAAGAFDVAAKIRMAMHEMAIPHAASPLHIVTVSIGLASVVPHDGVAPDRLIAAADTALYRSKSAGRDQVMQADVHGFEPAGAVERAMPCGVPTA